jgi:hypothetical protein
MKSGIYTIRNRLNNEGYIGRAKLTDIQVEEICKRRNDGGRVIDLAKEFDMHPGSITRITRGNSKW